ncbi:hypothetical protein ABZ896_21535 [Streptomyces sp. NPDC047072]|uniref:SCO2400 family protein n=1 Tax=Streptomyces sp. NPDC047072 TaxID=3154809 RepID=UPI0033DFC6BB
MDYCSSCRRHLNGALACPGCGAYAPDIAPLPLAEAAPVAAHGAAVWQDPGPETWHDPAAYAEDVAADPYDGTEGLPVSPTGRAARRRQRERWKKTQRRALVATAVALVGGGLTVASMERQSTDRTQAASAPDREVMGGAEDVAVEPASDTATTPGTHQSTPAAAGAAHKSTAKTAHEQAAALPQATPTTQAVRQDTAAAALPKAVSATTAAVDSVVSGASDTVSGTTSTPTASATDSSSDSTSSSSDSASTATPSTSATDSSGLCLLGGVLCIN